MIWLVNGPPGSGKTYYACRKIADALASGKVVVTNVQLVDDWAERVAETNPWRRRNKRAVAERAAEYRTRLLVISDMRELINVRVAGVGEGRAIAVIDEVQTFLNSRSWSEADRKTLVEWCQRHRHYGFDCIFIAQLASTVDKSVRELYEELVKLKNLRNFKVAGIRVFPRPRFVAIHTWNTVDKHVLKRESYGLTKRVAGLYNTHQYANDLDEPGVTVMPRAAVEPAELLDRTYPPGRARLAARAIVAAAQAVSRAAGELLHRLAERRRPAVIAPPVDRPALPGFSVVSSEPAASTSVEIADDPSSVVTDVSINTVHCQ